METIETLKAALRLERTKRAEAEQARDVAISRVEQLMADNERAVQQTVQMKLKSEKMAQKALANANKKSHREALAVKKELSYLRTTGQERVNQARKERDEFERQLRNVTEKLHKSNAQRRTLKETLANEKASRLATRKESNDILLKVTLEREAHAKEIESIRASAKQQVADEKIMTDKLKDHKLKLKRRLQESRRSLSDAEAQLRVERHTIEQLQAEINHRSQQFNQLKDEIGNIQKNMEEARQANETEKFRLITKLNEAHKVESDLRAKLAEEHNLLETAQRLIDREQEVATNLRKDIVSREDDLAKLQTRYEEQSERNAEMSSLLEQRKNALNALQDKLDAKLDDEQKLLASLEEHKIKFQQFEADKKELEQKFLQSEENALAGASRLKRIEDALQARNISPEFLLEPVATQTDVAAAPTSKEQPSERRRKNMGSMRSSRRQRTMAGARSDSALTDKSFKTSSHRSESDRSRRVRRHRSSSRHRSREPRSERRSSGEVKRDTASASKQKPRRIGWKF